MTTIIVKGANFAGGKMLHYEPPVADLKVCAWVGGDDAVFNKNFGTLGNLTVPGTTPAKVDDLFRRFDLNSYMQLPIERKASMTVMAVFRDVTPPASGTTYGYCVSSERDHGINGANYGNGRRGLSFGRGYNVSSNGVYSVTASNWGDNAGASVNSSITVSPLNDATPIFYVIDSYPNTTGTAIRGYRLTPTAANSGIGTSAVATTLPDADEATYPLLVGRSYRTAFNKTLDLAFIAAADRILTATERAAIYESVKRRFTAFSIAV